MWFYCQTWKSYKNQIDQQRSDRKYNSRSSKRPKCIPSNDQHNCSSDNQNTSNIFLNSYKIWRMIPRALMSLNHTDDRDSMSNQYLQPSTHQPRTDSYPLFSSVRTTDSKRKGLRVSFAFLQKNYLQDGQEN